MGKIHRMSDAEKEVETLSLLLVPLPPGGMEFIMKKLMVLLLVMVYVLAIAGCTPKTEQPEPEALAGYIVIEGNTLYLDTVEVITLEDTERITELGLDQQDDMPNGYYINNPDTEKDSYDLTDETTYTFVDSNLLFIKDEGGNRSYTTTKKEEFIHYLSTSYSDLPPAQNVPFFIQVKDGKVISIIEKFEFTI